MIEGNEHTGMAMSVEYVAERILAASHSRIHEIWIAKGAELVTVYVNQYMPTIYSWIADFFFSRTLAAKGLRA